MKNSLIGQMVKVPWLGNWSYALVLDVKGGRAVCVDRFGGMSHEIIDRLLDKRRCEPRRTDYTNTPQGHTAWMLAKESFNNAWNAEREAITLPVVS